MNRYNALSAIALIVFIILVPVYAAGEPARREAAQLQLRRQLLNEGATLYVQQCASCHGPAGEGAGAVPALSNPALHTAAKDHLFDVIARATHGSNMSAWHLSSGGALTDYQVLALVTIIRFPEWEQVGQLSREAGVVVAGPPAESGSSNPLVAARWTNPSTPWRQETKEAVTGEDAHQCAACHEEPAIHAERFGLDCVRCHTLEAWQPALLTQHTFELDHGDQGQISCQTCHQSNYYEHTCYGCHDHTRAQMAEVHLAEGIEEYETCQTCHPTGHEGEAQLIMELNAFRPEPRNDEGEAPDTADPVGAGRDDAFRPAEENGQATAQPETPAHKRGTGGSPAGE